MIAIALDAIGRPRSLQRETQAVKYKLIKRATAFRQATRHKFYTKKSFLKTHNGAVYWFNQLSIVTS